MKKRTLSLLLVLCLVVTLFPIASATTPADPSDGLIPASTELTRGVFFYALWKHCGSPEPTIDNSFTDLKEWYFYYKACLWAVETGITTGTSTTTFSPNQSVYRAQVAAFLYRALADDDAQIPENTFTDLDTGIAIFDTSALWVHSMGLMSARHEHNQFAPYEPCYYGQIYWDGTAPAVDTEYWYMGETIEYAVLGDNIDFAFDESTGELTLLGSGPLGGISEWHLPPWPFDTEQIRSVVIQEGITAVGSRLFADCINLETVSLPDTVTVLRNFAFSGCASLETISMPDKLTTIGERVFYDCPKLRHIVLPDTLTSIGNYAFHNCQSLESIVIPESVTTLEWGAFSHCTGLSEANIPNGTIPISDRLFVGCENLRRIYIPATVTEIECEAFDQCNSLTDVYYGGTEQQWNQISIDYSAWGGTNQVLKTAKIHYMAEEPITGTCGDNATWTLQSNGVLTISGTGPMYDYQIAEITVTSTEVPQTAPWSDLDNRINTVVICDGITHIGANAFSRNNRLTSVIIADSVESIGSDAFASCENLNNVYYGGSQEQWNELFGDSMDDFPNIYVDMPDNPFYDVTAQDFYCGPVLWALENNITTGASETSFNPNGHCLRAQVVTFLHRAAKNPEPVSTVNPFTDVKTSDFFYKSVLWAVEKGITNGVSATEFGSYAVCNRAAVVTFLWRAAGSPEPVSTANPFTDVKTTDFFYKPVLWAIENGITNGLSATKFGPTADCNRAQVVTFLYRAYS